MDHDFKKEFYHIRYSPPKSITPIFIYISVAVFWLFPYIMYKFNVFQFTEFDPELLILILFPFPLVCGAIGLFIDRKKYARKIIIESNKIDLFNRKNTCIGSIHTDDIFIIQKQKKMRHRGKILIPVYFIVIVLKSKERHVFSRSKLYPKEDFEDMLKKFCEINHIKMISSNKFNPE